MSTITLPKKGKFFIYTFDNYKNNKFCSLYTIIDNKGNRPECIQVIFKKDNGFPRAVKRFIIDVHLLDKILKKSTEIKLKCKLIDDMTTYEAIRCIDFDTLPKNIIEYINSGMFET